MIKKIVALAMMFLGIAGVYAQQPQGTPLPLNPAVKHGQLPNGLSYYIMHNEEPKNRANFYIAQKVGSTLETSEQLGLAHFLEHMAFNGSKHFPGKNMLNYLQAKGIRFGADINAYTSFDETVYNIDNIPCDDKALMDSVLLVLYDWSGSILLETDEIEAERKVIQEEWRTRDSAGYRFITKALKQVYQEPQYQQMPIGTMDVVMNFKPETLRDYYHTWYRPDQQGIVVVGDFDVEEMEQKVIKLFSDIPMPENAPERKYPTVSDNTEPIYFAFQDPETQYSQITVSFKYDKTPFEMRNTIEAYIQDNVLESVLSSLINNRLNEYLKDPKCAYAYAGVNFGDFIVSKTKGAFDVSVVAKDDINKALEDAFGVIARACKTGFTDSELGRVRDEMIANYEKLYNERNNTKTETLAREIIRHFVDNEPAPGIETEFALVQQVLPTIPVQAINQVAAEILTSDNQVFMLQQPDKGGQLPEQNVIIGTVENALNANYEAYVDEVITDPLVNKYNKPGKVKSTTENKQFGTTEMVLSNGVTVVVKNTDFKADEILFTARRNSGKKAYDMKYAPTLTFIDDIYSEACMIGNFNPTTLQKYLAGKRVSLSYSMGPNATSLEGSTTKKDLETLFDLVYASFTGIGADRVSYDAMMAQVRPLIEQQSNNPSYIFSENITKSQYGNNPMMNLPTVQTIDAVNYDEALNILRGSMANAADYTFYFVGNVDAETLRPMLEKYIASLPSKGKPAAAKVSTPIDFAKGDVMNQWQQPMQNPATMIRDIYTGYNLPYTVQNQVEVSMLGEILGMIFTETIREEMGAAYSPGAAAYMSPYDGAWILLYQIDTNADQKNDAIARADKELDKLLTEGATQDHFIKAQGAALKQYENNVRTNNYWLRNLQLLKNGWNNITDNRAAIENLTFEQFNAFLKTLKGQNNRIQVIMNGIPVEK